MPFWSSKKKVAEGRGPTKEEQEAAKKEEEERIQEERNERLLPWNLEQKVAVVLNPIKVPFIILAGLLGSVVEVKIGMSTTSSDTWTRGFTGPGPECVVHKADYNKLLADTRDNDKLSAVTDALDNAFSVPRGWINKTAHDLATCTTLLDEQTNRTVTRCDLFGGPLVDYVFEAPDNCNIEWDNVSKQCIMTMDGLALADKDELVGVAQNFYVPYALIWMIFKLVWIPGYYIDRAARLASGDGPPPEPMMKLISEPTCDKTGKCGQAGTVFSVLGTISKVIRFSLLPNTLILPLTSVRFIEQCRDEYIIYTQDTSWGFWIYCWLMFDLITTVGMYAAAQTVMGGKALGTMWYRCYKMVAIWPTMIALSFFFADLACCFSLRFWVGLRILLQLIFTLNLTFNVTLDIAKTVANTVIFFDILQFTIMIMSLLCPKLLAKAPVPEWLQEWTAQPDDIKSTASLASVSSTRRDSDERRGLLGTTAGGSLEDPPSPRPTGSPRPTSQQAQAKAKAKPKGGLLGFMKK